MPDATKSTFDLVKELEARISLVIPSSWVKEESVSEGVDKQTSRYVLVWYTSLALKGKVDVPKEVSKILNDISSRESVAAQANTTKRSNDTSQVMVTLSPKKEASFKKADAGPTVIAFSAGLDGVNYYQVQTQDLGTSFDLAVIHGDQEPLYPEKGIDSFPAALGKLLKYMFADLALAGEISKVKFSPSDLDAQFIAGFASWFINSPVVTKDAQKHLVQFVELVTKKKFETLQKEG